MKIICAPETLALPDSGALRVDLYGRSGDGNRGSVGLAMKRELQRSKLQAAPRAWDFLAIALSVVTADFATLRSESPDGWTREIDLTIAVSDAEFWSSQATALTDALAFLTTDRWSLTFVPGGTLPESPRRPIRPLQDCVLLLSGGLDSLVGAIDRVSSGQNPFAISQTVRGDAKKQVAFASIIGGGLRHLQMNHNALSPGKAEDSQRGRSLIFLAYGALAATTTQRYLDGDSVTLYACENGFIALNPPLTGGRLGSLSTRTAHPNYLGRIQHVLDAAGLRVKIENPYAEMTKGEMLLNCSDQALLVAQAAHATSCGRFLRFGYKHCGRCVPCQVRRAAFTAWKIPDGTQYVYQALGKDDGDHAGFDDVRSVAMALAEVAESGLDTWLGPSLAQIAVAKRAPMRSMVGRALDELAALHKFFGVR